MANYVPNTPEWVRPIIDRASQASGVPSLLLSALLKQESGFNPKAVSSAGAQGIAQFMPGTSQGMGVDPWDPESAIMGAARYLSNNYNQFGDWKLALAAYNAGPGNVRKYGGIPPFKETQNYVKNIMGAIGAQETTPAQRVLDSSATQQWRRTPYGPQPITTAPENGQAPTQRSSPTETLFEAIRRLVGQAQAPARSFASRPMAMPTTATTTRPAPAQSRPAEARQQLASAKQAASYSQLVHMPETAFPSSGADDRLAKYRQTTRRGVAMT